MADKSPLQDAIQASGRLRAIAGDLCVHTSCVQFCATLQVVLADIVKWLRTLPDDQDSDREANGLLYQLESLCQPQDPGQSATTGAGPYPSLDLLKVNVDAVTSTIRRLASSTKCQRQRKTALVSLQTFLPDIPEDDIGISPSDSDLRPASDEPPEYSREIVSLHRALFAHCCCENSEKVAAHIRLHNSVQDDSKVTFGVIFKGHPHHDGYDLDPPLWQDTHVSVQRSVTFEDNATSQYEQVGLDSDPSFCTYISSQGEDGAVFLCFSIMGQMLYFETHHDDLPRLWELDRPSISLGQILGEACEPANALTEKMKEVLSWLLAKAVWQYYNSPWMCEPWNKDGVHFLFERRRTGKGEDLSGIFVNEPLLPVSIVPSESGTKAKNPDHQLAPSGKKPGQPPPFRRLLHPIPKILALGVMLVEIQLGQPIESLYRRAEWSQYCPKGKANPNTNFKICRDLVAKPQFFADISDPLENLIKHCIVPNDLFVPPHIKDEEGIREALYGLVSRLEVYLSKRKPNSVQPLILPRISASRKAKMAKSMSPSVTAPARLVVPPVLSSSYPREAPPKTEPNPFVQA